MRVQLRQSIRSAFDSGPATALGSKRAKRSSRYNRGRKGRLLPELF